MARARQRNRRRQRGWGRRIVGLAMRAVLIFLILSVGWVLLYRFVPPPITFTMVGDMVNGRGVTKDWMPLARIDDDMKRAAIAGEDSKFCSHAGFDQDAIAEAMRRNAQGGKVIRGGSTISQQTAKNAFLWQGGGYFRKGLEAYFTLLIENLWPKHRIMEVYLNVAETGIGTYGVNAGSQRYFGHDASSLTRTEAARIAAVLPLPKKRDALTPKGFTRRYGNSIAARIGLVSRDGLDSCLYGKTDSAAAPEPAEKASPRAQPRADTPKASETPAPPPVETPGEEYEQAVTFTPADTQPAEPTPTEPASEPPQ